jgi:V/A-type H+-transporting ATPase subunit A
MDKVKSVGTVVEAFANLLHIHFEGDIRQGELVYVKVAEENLLGEVIEIAGRLAKVQVFEDTRGVKHGTQVEFLDRLLEAELGPGLLTSIFDGLQNPLPEVSYISGEYLQRGVYRPPLDRKKLWSFEPLCKEGDVLKRGDLIGVVQEGRFPHYIMVPFSFFGDIKITKVQKAGSFHIDHVVAEGVGSKEEVHKFTMVQRWPVKSALIAGEKVRPSKMMDTGLRIIDTQFPVLKGGTFCSPGPFGAGKTVMQHHLSKYSSVDIVVIVACGERAGEVVEVLREFPVLTDPRYGESLMKRTVMICNTSSMPVAAREASVYMGATIAEYYRQMGLDVLLLADSTSRWAQAMREMSGRLEEIPGEEAFPAYLPSRIAAFYERSGVVSLPNGKQGSLTIGGSVSPAGGNFEEPVTQASLSVVGAFHGLSRTRSDARRYPAVDPLISWTKYLDSVSGDLKGKVSLWSQKVLLSHKILKQTDEIGKRMEVVGEEGIAMEDFLIYLKGELYDFAYLQQNAFDKEDSYCPFDRQVEMFELIQHIFQSKFNLETHESARKFFRKLQNDLKNLNFYPFQSESYQEALLQIKKEIKGNIVHA